MPGIIGFKGDQPPETIKQLLDTMAHELQHESWYKKRLYCGDGFGLGHVSLGLSNLEPQLFLSDDNQLCLVMEGEIYDCEELIRRLVNKRHISKKANFAEILFHLYQDMGDKFALCLNGAFIIAIVDLRNQKIILANDRLGLRPLYYVKNNKDFIFASKLGALCAYSSISWSINPLALAQLLSIEYPLGDQTLLADARLLPPATILTFKDGELNSRSYWDLEFKEVNEIIKEEEYLEKFYYYMDIAVRRQANHELPTGILLSGGLDSRLLLGFLSNIVEPGNLHSLTFGLENSNDARFARRLAARSRTQHHYHHLRPDYLSEIGEEGVKLTSGMMSCVHMHSLANLRAQSKSVKVIFKGFLGDALMGGHLDRDLWAQYDEDTLTALLFNKHCVLFKLNELEDLFTDQFRRIIRHELIDSFRKVIQSSSASLAANVENHFDLRQRQRRFILGGVELVRSQVIVCTPFCDNDLVDFMLTIPPGLRFERLLVVQTLINYFPELAKIPCTPSGFPLMECAEDIILRANQFLHWHFNWFGLCDSSYPQRRPYADYNKWMRTSLRAWVEGILLDNNTLGRGYFNPSYIEKLVTEHMNGANHAVRLGALLSIELWHRRFLD